MTNTLDNQELRDWIDEMVSIDRESYHLWLKGEGEWDENELCNCILARISKEAHRIGNLAIGEDEDNVNTDGDYSANHFVYMTRNNLRASQRQELSTLAGVKEHE